MITQCLSFTEEQKKFILENYHFGKEYCCNSLALDSNYINYFYKKYNLFEKNNSDLISLTRTKIGNLCNVKSDQFLNIYTPEVAYFLGYFWADGCIRTKSWCVSLTIAKEDYYSIKNTLDKIGNWTIDFKGKKEKESHKDIVGIRTSNKEIKLFLLENDFYEKSFVQPIKILSKIPDELKHYWWRGYFDGDGCIAKGEYKILIAAPYDYCWDFTENLFRDIGVEKYSIRKVIVKTGRGSTMGVYNKKGVMKFLGYIYQNRENDNIGLTRKYNLYKSEVLERFENNKKENRIEAIHLGALKANFSLKNPRNSRIRGVSKSGKNWLAVSAGRKHSATFSNYNAAVNFVNYYSKLDYGDLYPLNSVELEMYPSEFNKYKTEKIRNKYTGISFKKSGIKRWMVKVWSNKKTNELGSYLTLREAINAYNKYIDDNNLQIPKHIVSEQEEKDYLAEIAAKALYKV